MHNTDINPLKLNFIPGNSTNIEPRVNPIIVYKVCGQKFFNKKLVIFIKQKQPIANPIPIGIITGIYNVEIE